MTNPVLDTEGLALYDKLLKAVAGGSLVFEDGKIILKAVDGTVLGETPVVRSVNNIDADASGNVAITSVDSATKATKDADGNTISSTYLKTATASNTYLTKTDASSTYLGKTAKAASATKADTATSATSATKATQDADGNTISATYLKKADAASTYLGKTAKAASAATADSATTATKATQDGDGNVIADTYLTKTEKAASATVADSANAVAWDNVSDKPSSYTPSSHNQASSTINALTGYSKPSSTSALATSDTLNSALGKLEKALDGKLGTSGTAAKATADASGNTITSTYATKSELTTGLSGKLGATANAASASKWATARTITLGGDASGSVSLDGSANKTLTVTVADDSHNHVISNVDGLQSALDAKASTTSVETALTTAKAYTDTAVASLVDSAPETLNTLGELAEALQENEDVTDALNTAIGTKANDSEVVKLTGNQTIAGTKTFSSTISGSISGNAATATKATKDGSGNVITSTYLTKTDASNTYLGKTAKAASAVTADSATSATSASSATKASKDADGNVISTTYLKSADASATYLTKTDAESSYLGITAKAASATTADSASSATTADSATKATQDGNGAVISSTYLKKTDASSTYLTKTDASNTYLSKTTAASTYLGKTAKAASATTADSATKASQDADGHVIADTYVKTVNGQTPTEGNVNIATRNVGDEWVSYTGVVPQGGVPYLGQEVSREMYADLYAYAEANGLVVSESEWQSLSSSQNGNVSKYSSGNGSTTFRMPRIVGYVKGASSLSEAGAYTKEGLPNITGTFDIVANSQTSGWKLNTHNTGAFYGIEVSSAQVFAEAVENTNGGTSYSGFDASRSNPIYGNSSHVTPETSVVLFGVYAFGEVTNQGSVDVADVANAIARIENSYLPLSGGDVTGNLTVQGKTIAVAGDYIPFSGSRGMIAGYETNGTNTTINASAPDSNQTGSNITVQNGMSGTSWTKIVRVTAAVSVTLGSSWKWQGNKAPTIASGGILVCCWCGSGGIANFISPS